MAKRRGNNEGTVYKLANGTWVSQVTVGNNPKTGKINRKSFYGKTRKAAVEKMNKLLQELKKGNYVEPTKYLYKNWLDKWFENYVKGRLKSSTCDSYESLIRVHIKPGLGEIPMSKLQTHMMQDFYKNKLKDGRSDGKGGLSERAVRHLHTVINLSLEQAVEEGLLSVNVAKAAKPPQVKSKKMKVLTEDELVQFINFVKGDRFYSAYFIAASTGLRRGELLGLCWDSVDLEKGIIKVERQLLVLSEGVSLDDGTKSKLSRRAVKLNNDSAKVLTSHKDDQDKVKEMLLSEYNDNDLVFARDDGSYLDPREFSKRFQRKLQKAGLPKIWLHDLRHTHASLLLSRNIHPKIVQERLGHSSINITLDLYSHLCDGLQDKAAKSLDGLFSNNEESD